MGLSVKSSDRPFYLDVMSTPIEQQIVVAVSSRALFNLEDEHRIFEEQGVEAYRAWQVQHANEPLEPGTAFQFIRKLLRINTLFGDKQPFRVVVLSRNTPETGQRFFNSCRAYNLPITAGAFTSGQSTFPYLQAFDASLFLSANKENVLTAIARGQPAGLVIPTSQSKPEEESDDELRIAFDFDGVVIDDEAEKAFHKEGIQGFALHEHRNRDIPHQPGPMHRLFTKLGQFQAMDAERGKGNPYFKPVLRVSIVTARGAMNEERLITSLKSFGMSAAELFLMDGLPKKRVLDILKPHIYFDDQLKHVESTSATVPSVLVPFGINNFVH